MRNLNGFRLSDGDGKRVVTSEIPLNDILKATAVSLPLLWSPGDLHNFLFGSSVLALKSCVFASSPRWDPPGLDDAM